MRLPLVVALFRFRSLTPHPSALSSFFFLFFVFLLSISTRNASSLSRPLAAAATRMSAAVPLSAIPQARPFAAAAAAKAAPAAAAKADNSKYEKFVKVPESVNNRRYTDARNNV